MHKYIATAVLALLTLPALAQEGMLHPVPVSDAASLRSVLNRKLLPDHVSHLEVEPKQVFRLVAPGQPDLVLVPVVFWHGEPSPIVADSLDDRNRCGLFIIPADGTPQTFVYTLTGNEDLAVSQCGNLLAIRRTPHDGTHPALRLTYRTFDPPRFEDSVDIILKWDPKAATYKVATVIPGK